MRFAFRPPHQWRLDTADGIVLTDEETAPRAERPGPHFPTDDASYPWDFDPTPARLILCAHSPLLADATLIRSPRAVGHDGRRAWEVVLRTGPPPGELHLIVDADTGILLKSYAPAHDYAEELTDLTFGALPEAHFRWGPGLAARRRERIRALEQLDAHYRTHPLPLPAHWPAGRLGDCPFPYDGDPETGFVVVDLDLVEPGPEDRLRGAQLVRLPLDAPPYEVGRMQDPNQYVHHWRDRNWHWYLILDGRPLDPEELRRVAASLPGA
ncbi:hypothetical protein [Streptomyces sp. TLI_146]|uniref:hypothetical protein n=1 Tax=Streptomyces sp. TLI_146 TaxID=1938858 RepID=UPI000C7064D0|nr:hypothetical protein [Streptomyces sp. TLI_146]